MYDSKEKLEELCEMRKAAYEINVKNGFNLDEILAGIYKDPNHFIYELIQNAEDAGANEISIELFEDRIQFSHNSPKNFNYEDFKSITSIGNSTKGKKINKIGQFGIGFKSVFSITNTPCIYSGGFGLRITNYYVPEEIPDLLDRKWPTTIILPFDKEGKSLANIYNQLKTFLCDLNTKTLLFLNSIKKISLITQEKEDYLIKEEKEIQKGVYNVKISNSNLTENYLTFKRELSMNKELCTSIAFKMNGEGEILLDKNTNLFVFFKTEIQTFLSFYVHGPFRTTPSRENIPENNDDNIMIYNEIGIQFKEAIEYLVNNNILTPEVLEGMPITDKNNEASILYMKLNTVICNMIEMNKIIPTTTGYGRANDIVIVDNSNIEKIYEMLHLEEVYHRNLFLDYNVNLKITPILYNKIVDTNVVNFTFLKLKPIKRITLYDICMNIKDDSFSGIDDEDLLFFYKVICIDNKNKLPRNLLITTPFVKKNDNTFGAAYELKNGEYVPLIFQPGNEIKDSHCINKKIGDTEIGKEFFKYVAIEEGKDGDILLSLCREFEGIENLEEYKLLMDKVLNIYVTFSSENRERVASKTYSFSKLAIFTTEDKEKDFCKPCECIYNKGPLNILFENEFIRILYSGIYDGDDRNKVLYEEFMRFSGVKTKLTYLRVAALSHLEKLLITRLNTLKKKHVKEENHDIEGLDSVLTNMTLEKSFALWNLLLYTPSEYYHGVLSWVIGRETFPSVFLKKLRNNSWIYLDGFLYSPLELFQEELPEEYTKAPDIMMQSLQFMNYNPNIKFTYQRFKSYIDKGYSRVASIDKLIKEQDEIEIDVDDVEAIIQEYNDTAITEDDNAEEMGSGKL